MLSSCSMIKTYNVAYQSFRTHHAQPSKKNPIPDEAKIAIAYTISKEGKITAIVFNRTSEIMTIDQTKSFFVNNNGKSTSYYDPTIRTTSTTDMSSITKGASVNLGSIAGALGIGGIAGQIANGINVGGSGTNGTAITNTTYISDLPQVSIAPYGNGAMSKVFQINGIYIDNKIGDISKTTIPEDQSHCRFSICVSYSFDGGKTFDKIVTNFYANSKIVRRITKNGYLNDPLKQIYSIKPDAINEYLWILNFNSESSNEDYLKFSTGILYDYK